MGINDRGQIIANGIYNLAYLLTPIAAAGRRSICCCCNRGPGRGFAFDEETSMRKAAFCTILLVLGIFLLGARPVAAAPRYTCLDLDKVPGMELHGVYPRGIDAAGEVVGYYLQVYEQPSLS